jgi:hypothetical protein
MAVVGVMTSKVEPPVSMLLGFNNRELVISKSPTETMLPTLSQVIELERSADIILLENPPGPSGVQEVPPRPSVRKIYEAVPATSGRV